jgi:hypothetical protein
MRIMGPPSEQWDVLQRLLVKEAAAPLFIDEIAPAIWEACSRYGIDAVGAIAQSAKETDWGKFTGTVPPSFYNVAGIKIHPANQKLKPGVTDGDNLLAHDQFGSWWQGALAQAHHLRAYTGWGVPERDVAHARYWAVLGNHHITDFIQLSNRWAGTGYGEGIVSIASRLVEVGL